MKLILSSLILISSLNTNALASENIVGGQLVSTNTQISRRTVALYMLGADGSAGLCTGSILHKGAILTAAHCIKKSKAVIVIFSVNKVREIAKTAIDNAATKLAGLNYRIANNFRMLPGYSGNAGGSSEYSDLALITFDGGLPQGYEPAHFLNQAETAKVLTVGAPVTLAGYGITSREERDGLTTGPQTSGTLRQVTIQFAALTQNKMNMVLQGNPGKDACSGDSGGPAMVNVNGNLYVVGVASRSDCVTTSIYTTVPREKAMKVAQLINAYAAY